MSDELTYGPAFDIGDQVESRFQRWARSALVTWTLFASLGLLAYELTSNPVLGGMVLCLKFGLNEFLAAIWAGEDPHPHRGRAIRYCCLANSFYKIGLFGISFLSAALVVSTFDRNRVVAIDHRHHWVGVAFLLGGVSLGYLSAVCAAYTARRHKLQLWHDDQFHRSRRFGVFPPIYFGRRNVVPCIMVLAACQSLLLLIPSSLTFLVTLCSILEGLIRGNANQIAEGFATTTVAFLLTAGLGFALMQLGRALLNSASKPEQCWPELTAVETEDA